VKRFNLALMVLLAFVAGFVTRDQLNWLWEHVLLYILAIPAGIFGVWLYGVLMNTLSDAAMETTAKLPETETLYAESPWE
jgi:hypothetical protein